MTTNLITRLHDEADLCRNDGVPETAKLLDEAIARIKELELALKAFVHEIVPVKEHDPLWANSRALLTKKD